MDKLQKLVRLVPPKPARSLKSGYRGNRGTVTVLGQSHWHESDLERDLLLMLQFDHTLVACREQPETLECVGAGGRPTRYTADLITIHGGESPCGFIIEVKYISQLRKEWRTLKPRLKAGREFAHKNGLGFLLLTELQIRSSAVEALRFVNRFRDIESDESTEEHLVHRLAGVGPSSAKRLLAAAFADETSQAEAIPYLWKLVALGRIQANLEDAPITMASLLWIDRSSDWRPFDPYSRKRWLMEGRIR